jgi:hypothetical protein
VQTIVIAPGEEHLALRVLSALILNWDTIPLATQGRLLRDAALMQNSSLDATALAEQLLEFIERHKEDSRADHGAAE